ncbi:dTMP kinase [Verrucosispora sp. WMMD703]|uniref:dTMP kinase n=1 Tax=Verrucosispora sp. WMMD703 TaxID=3403463 RepID=UPI003B92F455
MIPAGRQERRFPFIALEGTDGSGKSTLRISLAQALRQVASTVTEFGQHSWLDTDAARLIVGNRMARSNGNADAVVEAYLRDKRLHFEFNIKPALAVGPVLTDRYVLSDIVYHHVLHGVPMERISAAMTALRMPTPDVIVFVDTPPALAWTRIGTRNKELRPYERPDTLVQLYDAYDRAIQANLVPTRVLRFRNHEELSDSATQRLVASLLSQFPQLSHDREVPTDV